MLDDIENQLSRNADKSVYRVIDDFSFIHFLLHHFNGRNFAGANKLICPYNKSNITTFYSQVKINNVWIKKPFYGPMMKLTC